MSSPIFETQIFWEDSSGPNFFLLRDRGHRHFLAGRRSDNDRRKSRDRGWISRVEETEKIEIEGEIESLESLERFNSDVSWLPHKPVAKRRKQIRMIPPIQSGSWCIDCYRVFLCTGCNPYLYIYICVYIYIIHICSVYVLYK